MSKITNIKLLPQLKLFGLMLLFITVITVSYFVMRTEISDQYDAIAVWQNNNEGNWDIAYAIYRQSNDSWFHKPDREIYYEGDANLIAKLPGDDNDPDIASTKHSALAVWSNTGSDGNDGADIFVARWSGDGWKKPERLFAFNGDDLDPTVYMQDQNNALVVWINENAQKRTLYYSEWKNGNWSNPKQIPVHAQNVSVPELGYITLPNSRYLLIFNARADGIDQAYVGTYEATNGWNIAPIQNQSEKAMIDESVPAVYRSSVSMHVDSRNVSASWSSANGNIWYMKASPANTSLNASLFGEGGSSVVMHDPESINGTDSIVFSRGNKLYNTTPLEENYTQTISQKEAGTVRPDAIYLIEQGKRSAVAVWESNTETPSEIYFSSVKKNSQEWTAPERIDSHGFAGEDKNPAIAPILIRFEKENVLKEEKDFVFEETYCGNKILEMQSGEECEIGIACPLADEICDWDYYKKIFGQIGPAAAFFSQCECLPFKDEIEPPKKVTPGQPKITPKNDQNDQKGNQSYGGAACGFNEAILKSSIGGKQVSIKFLPETIPENGTIEFHGGYPSYQVERAFLFPTSGRSEAYFTMIDFSNDGREIKMTGIASGYKLCDGVFVKGAPPEQGGLMPAPAKPEEDVPSLPFEL